MNAPRLLLHFTLALATWRSAHASGDAVLDLLLRKGIVTSQEVAEVKQRLDAEMAQVVEQYSRVETPRWVEESRLSGELRLRTDYGSAEPGLNRPDRLRYRLRLRVGLDTKFTDWASVGMRLSSGEGDPISNYQTLTDTFRNKPINIDTAYVALGVPGGESVRVLAGKMPNPIWQPALASPMVYDGDVTPEGVGEQLVWRGGDRNQWRLFANLGQFSVRELARDANDAYLFDFLGGAEFNRAPVRLTGAGGFYFTHNLDNVRPGDSSNLGNTVTATTNYPADFQVAYVRGEAAYTLRKKPILGTPALLTFSSEYLHNISGDFGDDPDGWTVQAQFGETKRKGQWMVLYAYRRLEADATWDAITDSDFGVGGTDRQGHVLRLALALQDWWLVGANAVITEKISQRPNTGHNNIGVRGEDLLRMQLDNIFRF